MLEIPKEVAADDVVAPEFPVAPPPTNIVTPLPSTPVESGIPEVALDLGDIPLAAIAGAALAAFAAGTFLMRGRPEVSEEETPSTPTPTVSPSLADLSSSSSDVSIPYDAAARLAYDEWRAKFGKGAFDAIKYAKFKARYEMVTSKNMAAKKVARDTGVPPTLQELSADADS
jgi:hypothetical protein